MPYFMRRTPKIVQPISNDPTGTGQLHQYMTDATKAELNVMAKYATNFFAVQVQGLEGDTPPSTAWYEIRVADKFSSPNISPTSRDDDWQFVYFKRPDINYIPPGTKFWFWNNTWLAENPSNIASIIGNALVKRCNAVWNSLDYYGNIVSEPMVIQQPATKANANTDTETMKLADAYIDCLMQANEWTLANLQNNTRMILGSNGFAVRGLSDYIREYTDQQDSVRLLRFSLYYQEPLENDDMVNQVADGLAFSWIINLEGPRTVAPNKKITLMPSSLRNNDPVPDTQAVTYTWESLNTDIAAVDSDGVVTGVSTGQATIQCALEQNQNISTSITIDVQEIAGGLSWSIEPPTNVPAYQSRTLSVSGAVGPVTWSFSGPSESSYTASVNGAESTITCYYPSPIPLTVTVTDGQTTLTATVQLTTR